MPNTLDTNGLTVKTATELYNEIVAAMQEIYGADINVDSNSPDGQMINIFIQVITDMLELITEVYNSFDPDLAVGVILDQRVAINGIQRKSGTYTYVNIDLVVDRALNLVGADTDEESAFTFSDNEDNQFILAASTSISTAGTHTLSFRAKEIGNIQVLPNTITTPITRVLGVISGNNTAGATVQGVDEETDAELRLRRQASTSIQGLAWNDALYSALMNLDGVSYVKIYENTTDTTDSDGIPPHSIWAIIEGGTASEIANVIYSKRTAGSGMKGSLSYSITQLDGEIFVVKYDTTTTENLYIKFDVESLSGTINLTDIKNIIIDNLKFDIYGITDINEIISIVKTKMSNVLITNCFVSLNGSDWETSVQPTVKNARFSLSAGDITITEL